MNKRILCITGLLFLAGMSCAHAQDMIANTGFPSVLEQFRTASQGFGQKMMKAGAGLLAMLAILQVAWNGADRMIKGNFEIKSVIGNMVRTAVVTSFFFIVIAHSLSWFLSILDQWISVGGAAAGTGPLGPGELMATGLQLAESMREAFNDKMGNSLADMLRSFAISLQLVLVYVLVIFAFFVLAAQLALAMIKGYLWLCVGPLLIGFGGLKSTRDIAINTMKASISIGIVIVTVYAVAGMTFLMVPMWNGFIANFTLDNWMPFWGVVVSAGLLALTAWQVPKIANDFINGSVSGGVSEVASAGVTAAAGMAAAATGVGAMAAAGASVGGGSLGGVFQAINAGMQAASDNGHSGLGAVSSGIGTALGTAGTMAGERAADYSGKVLEGLKGSSNNSFGHEVAERIQSERGGSITMLGSGSPDVGTPGGDGSGARLDPAGGAGPTDSGIGGGQSPRSLSDKIKGLHDYIPHADSGGVSVGGVNGGPMADGD
jgi:type IV secretion system protein TrbL